MPIYSDLVEELKHILLTSKYVEGTGLISELQYGFRVFRSTADLLTVLIENIYNSLDVGSETRAIALYLRLLTRSGMLDCYTS